MVFTDKMIDAGIDACSLSYFQKVGDVWRRCSVDSDDVVRIVEAVLNAANNEKTAGHHKD